MHFDCQVHKNSRETGTVAQDVLYELCDDEKLQCDHCEDLDLVAGPMGALDCRVSTWLLVLMGIFEIIVDSVTVITVWLQLVSDTRIMVVPGLQDHMLRICFKAADYKLLLVRGVYQWIFYPL